jgi:hypothetical protein
MPRPVIKFGDPAHPIPVIDWNNPSCPVHVRAAQRAMKGDKYILERVRKTLPVLVRFCALLGGNHDCSLGLGWHCRQPRRRIRSATLNHRVGVFVCV